MYNGRTRVPLVAVLVCVVVTGSRNLILVRTSTQRHHQYKYTSTYPVLVVCLLSPHVYRRTYIDE